MELLQIEPKFFRHEVTLIQVKKANRLIWLCKDAISHNIKLVAVNVNENQKFYINQMTSTTYYM